MAAAAPRTPKSKNYESIVPGEAMGPLEEETDLHTGSSDFLDIRNDLLDPVIPFQWNQYLLSHDLFSKRVHCALLNSAVTIVRLLDMPFRTQDEHRR